MIGWVWGPMTRSIPSLMSGLPGPADAGDPAVLDADVGLDDPDDRVDDDDAGDHRVELRRRGRTRAGSCWVIRARRFLA